MAAVGESLAIRTGVGSMLAKISSSSDGSGISFSGILFLFRWRRGSTGGGCRRHSLHSIVDDCGGAQYQQYRDHCVEAMKVRRDILPVLTELHPDVRQRQAPDV